MAARSVLSTSTNGAFKKDFSALNFASCGVLRSWMASYTRRRGLRMFLETPFTALCQGIEAGAAFVMNFFLMREVSYFFPTLGPSALIHLWSLAIEKQFYIIWPLALYVVNAMRLQYLPCIIVVGAVSFAINIIKLHGDPMAAFLLAIVAPLGVDEIGASLSAMPTKRMPDLYFPPIARSIAGFLLIFAGFSG